MAVASAQTGNANVGRYARRTSRGELLVNPTLLKMRGWRNQEESAPTHRSWGPDYQNDDFPTGKPIRFNDHVSIPTGSALEEILRYRIAVHKDLSYHLAELERLQRARKGDHVPPPINVQVQ